MNARAALSALQRLETLRGQRGPDAAIAKVELLASLAPVELDRASHVLRLHEAACFLRAYPDDAGVLAEAERVLDGFSRRRDLRRHRRTLESSGIDGTQIHCAFYWETARWLAKRWPRHLAIDWPRFATQGKLESILHLLLPYQESLAIEGLHLGLRGWLEELKGPDESDAVFLIRRFEAVGLDPAVREHLYDDVEVPLALRLGDHAVSRTRSKVAPAAIAYRRSPARRRAASPARLPPGPRAIREIEPAEGQRLVDLARIQMITRERDLYAFMYADGHDVRMVDYPGGLQFAVMGLKPEWRLMLDAMYIALILHNGVPVGYTQACALMHSAEVNFSVFDTFRGTDASTIFRSTLSMVRALLGADAFVINTQQLGHGNTDALKTGAFWFYHKHGFRPRNAEVERVLARELAAKRRNPAHRSGLAALKALAADNLYRFTRGPRHPTSTLEVGQIGLAAVRYVAERFGSDRERADRECAREAARLLGLESLRSLSPGERCAWRRWSPLVLALPDVALWSRRDRRALADVVRAKGGRRESEFVARFDAHLPLRHAVMELANAAPARS